MPDGDRFYWKLRGPGSRKFVDVARSGASTETIGDQAESMFVQHLRKRKLAAFLPQMARKVHHALVEGRGDCQAFERLQKSLQQQAAEGNTDEAFIAARAAERIFTDLELKSSVASSEEVQTELLGAFAGDLVEHHALAPSRDVLMTESGRDAREQLEWETNFRRDLTRRVSSLRKRVFEGSTNRIRAPRRRSKQRKMTLEELHEPLQIRVNKS